MEVGSGVWHKWWPLLPANPTQLLGLVWAAGAGFGCQCQPRSCCSVGLTVWGNSRQAVSLEELPGLRARREWTAQCSLLVWTCSLCTLMSQRNKPSRKQGLCSGLVNIRRGKVHFVPDSKQTLQLFVPEVAGNEFVSREAVWYTQDVYQGRGKRRMLQINYYPTLSKNTYSA